MVKKKIVIAAVTCGRPEMFSSLLQSLSHLKEPFGTELCFCFVENDTVLTIEKAVKEFKNLSDFEATALIDGRRGIPFARNAALNWALGINADFLAFIDDDEIATENWAVNLYTQIEKRALDLVGGPVVPVLPNPKVTSLQALVFRGVTLRAERIARKNRLLSQAEKDGIVTIVTNNWLARLDFIKEKNVMFDESLGLSNGSDTAFFRAMKEATARTGWVSEAVVEEIVPQSRLTLGYQFLRAKDQAIASFRIRYPETISAKVIAKSVVFVVSKILLGLVRIASAAFDRGASLTLAMRAFGFAFGRVLALWGHKSTHYKEIHGT